MTRRTASYIYNRSDWPNFRWNDAVLSSALAAVRHRQGYLQGRMEALGFDHRRAASLETLTDDAVMTSDIEGETLDRQDVRSSFVRRLGIDAPAARPVDQRAEAIASVILDATGHHARPLTAERLREWHGVMFRDAPPHRNPITVGAWRTDAFGSMRVVSGALGKERVHFEAPAASRVPAEMDRFLAWFEDGSVGTDPVLKAAIAHIWFVTIHPFDDGNGRIARAIADLVLARADGSGQRFYSMSKALRVERKAYYDTLEATQKGDLEITAALAFFVSVLDRALANAENTLSATMRNARIWDRLRAVDCNARQDKMIGRLLDGFVGPLTTSKWARIAKCSQDAALRDIEPLVALGLLVKQAPGGRSTHYALADW